VIKIATKETIKIETESKPKVCSEETQHRLIVTLSGKMLDKLDKVAYNIGYFGQSKRANTIRHLITITEIPKREEE